MEVVEDSVVERRLHCLGGPLAGTACVSGPAQPQGHCRVALLQVHACFHDGLCWAGGAACRARHSVPRASLLEP